MIFGGQIKGEGMRLYQIYSPGNFIEATAETPYFQIGESKYGKPVLDRVITPLTPLDEAAKCALVSMDSTLKSNISVGLPLDMLVYEKNSLKATKLVTLDDANPYFAMIHQAWGEKLREAFNSIAEPSWSGAHKSSAISAPAKKMGAVPINHQLPKAKLAKSSAKPTSNSKKTSSAKGRSTKKS
jgi:putative proteasome-type protease